MQLSFRYEPQYNWTIAGIWEKHKMNRNHRSNTKLQVKELSYEAPMEYQAISASTMKPYRSAKWNAGSNSCFERKDMRRNEINMEQRRSHHR